MTPEQERKMAEYDDWLCAREYRMPRWLSYPLVIAASSMMWYGLWRLFR